MDQATNELYNLILNDFNDPYMPRYDGELHSHYILPSLNQYAREMTIPRYKLQELYRKLKKAGLIVEKKLAPNKIAIYLS
ncbi:hypothetical protein [Clostridium sp.]|uniref:hypothetical protein n=1 Tax=Clostridium sp. TaxID=1506 RepID=UPI00284F7B73|nr:hypothetical protein [Clostridium sp.]MDR3598507.1 hypothetical protein [Clostridium sp.]